MSSLDQIIQYIAWIVALFELIVGLYIVALNIQHSSNRHVSAFLMLLAVNTFAVGATIGSSNVREAMIPTLLLAATITAVQPALLITSVILLRPVWLRSIDTGIWRWTRWIPYFLLITPLILTIIDITSGAGLWFTGLDANIYQGGYAELREYANGSLHDILVISNLYITGTIVLIFLLSHSFDRRLIDFRRILRRKQAPLQAPLTGKDVGERNMGLARMLFAANLLGAAATSLLVRWMPSAAAYLLVTTVFVIAYAFGAFRQMISERRMQRGSLQARLTALVLIITIPLTIALTVFLGNRAQNQIEEDALKQLETASHTITDTTEIWLQYNLKALEQFVRSDTAINMDPQEQKAYLEAMTATYPEMYLISTTDLNGLNVARSDAADNTDYSDRAWYQGASDGNPVTYQTLIGRTSGQPALVVSMPIRDSQGEIVGVGMFASDLDEISHLVEHSPISPAGVAFVVDAQNRVIAHPDQSLTAELTDFSGYPPVTALNQGKSGLFRFEDQTSTGAGSDNWFAYINRLDNGWGTVTVQQESVLLAPARAFQLVSLAGALLGVGLLFALTIFTIRQGILPVRSLTETALAITEGDLTRTAPVDSEDELGLLARSFNTMTSQLNELISGLEERVSERTKDLERRALQLQVAAEVAREAAGIRDLEQLLTHTVNLISNRFGFYHAGIFLLTEEVVLDKSLLSSARRTFADTGGQTAGGYAILRAASSEGGQRMLARQHRLKVGQVGIVGFAAASGQPRIALDVGQDAVYFDNPDLPDTRSEMGLPLMIQNRVIGVLDVQSTEPSAFSDEDIAVLQILADQIALAIEDARLLRESQQALADVEALYGSQVQTSWQKHLAGSNRIYNWDASSNVSRLATVMRGLPQALTTDQAGSDGEADHRTDKPGSVDGSMTINVPIELRGQRLGKLVLKRQKDQGDWLPEEKEILDQTISQVALALESARLLQEAQRLAAREQQINVIASQVSASVNFETILQNTVRELGKALGASRTTIQIGADRTDADQVIGD